MQVCLELHQVTDTDLRRLKFKLPNKKPLDDYDNYEMNVIDSTDTTACDSTPTVLTVSVDTWHDKSCVLLLL